MSEDQIPADSKLTKSKRRWAAEGKFLTGKIARAEDERLPPGQHLVKNWPVLDLGQQPQIRLDTWRLELRGLVENQFTLSWKSFLALDQSRKVSDIHCVTTWSRYDNEWQGVATRDLLDEAMPKPQATHVLLTSYDGYTTNLPLMDFASDDAILATHWEGEPLTAWMQGNTLVLTDAKGGNSNVTIKDVLQSNGVIHVVDTVLLP